jgi:hypothetical protein
MFRKLRFVVTVPVFVIFVQARPITAPASPAGLLTQAWQWAKSGLGSVGMKMGPEIDPNGNHVRKPPTQLSGGGGARRVALSSGEAR